MTQLQKMMKFYEEVRKYHDLLTETTQTSPFWVSFYACEIIIGNDEPDIDHVWQMAAPMICELAESYGFDFDRNFDDEENYGELVINCRG